MKTPQGPETRPELFPLSTGGFRSAAKRISQVLTVYTSECRTGDTGAINRIPEHDQHVCHKVLAGFGRTFPGRLQSFRCRGVVHVLENTMLGFRVESGFPASRVQSRSCKLGCERKCTPQRRGSGVAGACGDADQVSLH